MRTKGVLILGLIVCWTVVCKSEDGDWDDYEIGKVSSNELAEDDLFRADKETCGNDSECQNGGKCEGKDRGNKFCSCNSDLTGDKCETILDCLPAGKYKDCKKSGGVCKYEGGKAVCKCSGNKKLDERENVCKDACSKTEDCKDDQICAEKDGWMSCQCAEGLSGENCDIKDWCETGKFKNCKGVNGTCQYAKEKRSVVCTCAVPERKFHPTENRCRETCTDDTECKYGGKCEEKDGGNKFCSCKPGLTEDKCATVFDCSPAGKYKDCQKSGGVCKYDGAKAVCECPGNKKLHDKDNKCKECDCGPKGSCSFENGEKKCDCDEGFADKDGKCIEICYNDCEHESECKEFGNFSFCVCNKGLSGDKCNIVDDCGTNGKLKNCTSERGTCEYDTEKKEAVCRCENGKEFNPTSKYCQDTCTTADECNGGQCLGKEGKNFCICKPQLEGDKCDIVIECVRGKYSKCVESGGKCEFDGTKSTCKCEEGKKLDETLTNPICRKKCSSNDECKNGATCINNLCKCPVGTEGDNCDKVTACDTLKCEEKHAKCNYDIKKKPNTFCVCTDSNFIFVENRCVAEWCKTGCHPTISTCEYKGGVGICTCKDEKSYYDYTANSCKKIDPCFNMTCEGDQICKTGKCECPENHKKNGKTCEPLDLCNPNNKCFVGAQCENGSALGYVQCLCKPDSKFYRPAQKKCDDGVCFLNVERKGCTKACPYGMKRKDGVCEHNDDKMKCDEDCGFLGWCKKVNETANECACDPNYAEKNKEINKCVLKASAVCPTKVKDGDNRCKCTGKYKQAANGITCELKSCSDEDVQNECKKKRAPKCVDNWKNDAGYKCLCPDGYIDVKDKGCIDPCSQDSAKDYCQSKGQICFLGQKLENNDCRCPPTFIYNENIKSCDIAGANTFMIHNLPILRKKYTTVEDNINEVLLNIDVSTSMMQAIRNLDFVHVFNFKVDNNVLVCDVWLQFKATLPDKFNASAEVERWVHQIVNINEQLILLPGIFLSTTHFHKAKVEKMTLCTPSVQQSVCGTGSSCVNNTCSCDTGFKQIESTIKASGDKRIVRCEDVDECKEGKHECKENSDCVNTLGDYFCKCKPGFKKAEGDANAIDKKACIGLCEKNPCGKGTCQLTKEYTIDCTCPPGYTGSFCNREDVNLAKAGKATKVVGAVLGTLLAIVIILIIVYIVRQRKNSYSEDFTPAPRVDNAEMVERRPMRGVTNRAYQ